MRTLLMLALYILPAVILFGATLALARVRRWNVVLPVERATWLLPGIVYAVTPAAPKGILNLIDPLVVASLCWLLFAGRIALAVKRPSSNRPAAYATIVLTMTIAAGIALFMPPLPQ
jgi:hypothetical protein